MLPDLSKMPDDGVAHMYWAKHHYDQRAYALALAHAAAAVLLKPCAGSHYQYGVACHAVGRLDDAEAHYREAQCREPEWGEPALSLAIVHLLQGSGDAWAEMYRVRQRFPKLYPGRIDCTLPEWTGQDLRGKHLCLLAYEGAGDAIQFCRYAITLKERFAGLSLTLYCHPSLVRLMGSNPALDRVISGPAELSGDYYANLMDMPVYFERIPAKVPYLYPDPELIDEWSQLPLSYGRRAVAIFWQGDPKHPQDAMRSVDPNLFLALDNPDVQLYSVQQDASNIPACAIPVNGLKDFADTAAVLSLMDLVITVDTSVAHLAGALGLPVWLALPRVPDYRWLLDRSDSPWYPTARLFRQRVAGQWSDVFEDMAAALTDKQLAEVA